MDDIIHLLPDSVANQIAAGEVVQRPASIIKEMVENSIDAGAKNIQVLVVDGGKTNVQIIDDGKGMSETDARMAFERHATSKIQKASDLFTLTTMGFRGEALASIAAVAQVDLKTRRKEDDLGTNIQISGSKTENQEPISCPVGSNFSVQNLFFNVPARRKFLKSSQTELSYIVQEFQQIVLVHPDISFHLYNNGVEMFRLPACSLRQRIVDVFGKKINTELLPIDVETSLVSISGYVAKPEASKKKGHHQYFFVNGRYMRHPYFLSAVKKAYENIIPVGEQISFFIYFSVDPSSIDVNVSPTKTDIKFDNEQAVWKVLSAAIKETIGKFCNVPMIDFDVEGKPDIPVMGVSTVIPQQPKPIQATYNPFASNSGGDSYHPQSSGRSGGGGYSSGGSRNYDFGGKSAKGLDNWDALYEGGSASDDPFKDSNSSSINDFDFENEAVPSEHNQTLPFEDMGVVPSDMNVEKAVVGSLFDPTLPKFQYKGQYIVFPSRDGLTIVDQHRAHVRVLYEQYLQNMKSTHRPTQKVLFPEIVQFTKEEEVTLEDVMQDISALGFEMNNLGGGSYSVSGIPSGSEGVNVEMLLHDIVSSAMEKTGSAKQEAQEAIALSMAQSSAVVYGQVLSTTEMNQILQDLFNCPYSARTPDGKIIYSIIDQKSVEKLF